MLTHFRIPIDALEKTKDLAATTTLIYIYLLCIADLAGSNKISVGHRDLSERTNINISTITKAKAQLVEAGLISIDRPFTRCLTDTITLL